MRRTPIDDAIDFSRPFMPARLTPLYHAPSFVGLTEPQRRRYNQLHACYLNEQTIFFESMMARPILRAFARQRLPGHLGAELEIFMAEEARHSEMFRTLNRRCRPEAYAGGDFDFIRLPRLAWAGLHGWMRQAGCFPFFLWVLLIQEERALFYATEFLAAASELEPSFVAAQRRHLADEVGHIRWDEQLLDWVWPRVGFGWRKWNARMFAWLMREYFVTPKRSAWHVMQRLLAEFPELRRQASQFRAELGTLGVHPEYNRLAYSRDVTPKSFARFDRWPEFAGLCSALPCYRPEPIAAASGVTEEVARS